MPRDRRDELMDRPGLDAASHRQALAGLRRINRLSRASTRMLGPVLKLARRGNLKRLVLMDVACGGGDVPIGVARMARRHGLTIELLLVDRSSTAINNAIATAKLSDIPCRGVVADILSPACPVQRQSADIVANSLFLHHLRNEREVEVVLRRMSDIARLGVLVSDLRRSRWGWMAAWIGCRLLSRSPIVHYDGPVSVRGAWTMRELSDMARNSGLEGVRVRRQWPWRMMLEWERDV